MARKSKTTKKKTISPEEKAKRALQRRHKNEIRSTFLAAGFSRAEKASDKEFVFEGAKSDFDDVFILENTIVLVEYTITKDKISDHVKPKFILYDKINNNKDGFVEFSRSAPLLLNDSLGSKYPNNKYNVIIVYCSFYPVDNELKSLIPSVKFLDYSIVRYFKLLTKTVKLSARSELLAFLGVSYCDFGDRALVSSPAPREGFPGSVLPENHSKFPKGYKVVSFYIHPQALLDRAYVLRRDGWRDRGGLYQRMIIKPKIESVRKYLAEQGRVFVNNIIVTLPHNTKILDAEENTLDPQTITNTKPATISIPNDFNSVGLIDGQHRVFSYYEGGPSEDKISLLRSQQNLLVTGIIYPKNVTAEVQTRFEASLFLEINSNQTNAKSELTQAINQIVRPFATDSIARDVLDMLNDGTGALGNKFARHYFETELLKTTSVVSYGLRPLIRPTSGGAMFGTWVDTDKGTFIQNEDDAARKRYVAYCANQVSIFVGAAKSRLPSARWTTDRKVHDRLLTPTVVNGLIGAMRHGLEAGVAIEFESLHKKFDGLADFEFQKYKSSHYTVMATDIFDQFLS